MKYAFMSYSCPTLDFNALLAAACQYGYDGIELRLENDHGHGIEVDLPADDRKRARQAAKDANVLICCLATSCRFADPATTSAAIETAHRSIDLAGDLGVPRIRVFGGVIAKEMTRRKAIEHVATALNELRDHAEKRTVDVCVETHDDWCDPGDMAKVMAAVDHPNVQVTWDLMHPVFTAGKSIDEAFRILRPWISHVHIHDCIRLDGQRVIVPIGAGMVDHCRAVELLHGMGYDGWLSGEWIRWRSAEEHLASELQTMKAYDDVQHN